MRGTLFRKRPSTTGALGPTGVTLVEVLVAIFIMGVGLLALLTLFPLGAIEMAQAIKDDRTATLARDAVAFSQAGEDLLSRTSDFVVASLSQGKADPLVAAYLREEYELLALEAADLEHRLRELRTALPPQARRYVAPLLAQIRLIGGRIDTLAKLLALVEELAT